MHETRGGGIEEQVSVIFVDGQRCEVWIRSEPDTDGTWHNALVFRRDGRIHGLAPLVTGVGWHVPPGIALTRAQELQDGEQIALFQRALERRDHLR